MADRGDAVSAPDRKMLTRELAKYDVKFSDFDYHPPVLCNYDMTRVQSKINTRIAKTCRKYLDDAIDEGGYKLAVTSHKNAIDAVVHKSTKVTSVRGVVTNFTPSRDDGSKGNIDVIGITSPVLVNMRPENEPTFKSDVRAVAAYINSDYDKDAMTEELDNGEYEEIDDLQFLVDAEPELLSFDIEAVGLRPYALPTEDNPLAGHICTLQFCIDGKVGYTLPWDHPDRRVSRRQKRRLRGQLKKLLQNPKTNVFGQNLKFDRRWIHMKMGFDFEIGDDTVLAAALLDENSPKGQDDLVKRYVPSMAGYADEFNATSDKSRMDLIPIGDIIKYGGGDVVSCFRLREVMLEQLKRDKKLYNNYRNVTVPAVNMFANVDSQGIQMDLKAFSKFREMMQEKVEAQRKSLYSQIDKSILKKHLEKGLSFKRPDFLADVLFHHPKGFRLTPKVFTKSTKNLDADLRKPSTSGKDHLPFFFDECPFTIELAQHIKDFQLLNNNIIKFEENFMVNNMVYPQYHLHIVVTGRTSSCLHADQLVTTKRGEVRAADIVVGDYVYTHKGRWRPVTTLYRKPPTEMVELKFTNGETLTCTLDHRVLVGDDRFVTVRSLIAREAQKSVGVLGCPQVFNGASEDVEVSTDWRRHGIEEIKYKGVYRVFDFEVEEDHSYLAAGIFSHNSDPNGQNIPKRGKYAKAYRRAFVPPSDEYIIMEADLSQAELRIAADMANEKEMIRIYREDGDIHRATAVIVSGLTQVQFDALPKKAQKDYRQKAKAVNFGFLYGMGWRTFITYAKTDYGVTFTDSEAQGIRNRFFLKYKALPKWHKAMREYAHAHGFVRSYSGRIRHLPQINSHEDYVRGDAERQAINSPVQEFSSTMGVLAMTRMSKEIDPYIMRPLAFVHDAIFVLVRKEYVDWGARTLKWYMESNDIEGMFGIKLKLPIKADVAVGVNLGDQYELDGLEVDQPYDFNAARKSDQAYLCEVAREESRKQGRRVRPEKTKFPKLPPQLTPDNNGMRLAA